MSERTQKSVYELLGGAAPFRRLVDEFYKRVEQDPELRPLFPADLEAGKQAQYLFLMQYFGGPDDYSQQRGHPRLRMRHAPFSIGPHERDLWLAHMLEAVDAAEITGPARDAMQEYFKRSATFMINRPDEGHPSLRVI